MTSTYTPSLRLEVPAQGDYTADWGPVIDQIFNMVDASIAGLGSITITGGTLALTANNATADQARLAILSFIGALTSAQTITIPNVSKKYFVINGTSGAYALTLQTISGVVTTAAIPQGYGAFVYCDGNGNVQFAGPPVTPNGIGQPFGASGPNHSGGGVPDPGSIIGSARYLREDGTWVAPAGSGTVTSVAATVPAEFAISGSPISSVGTLAITKANQAANTVWAGPSSGSAVAPTFRALVGADLPALTGDVSSSAGVVTIGNNIVTNAKSAQMVANTIKGNLTGSTATAADNTVSAVAAAIGALAVADAGLLALARELALQMIADGTAKANVQTLDSQIATFGSGSLSVGANTPNLTAGSAKGIAGAFTVGSNFIAITTAGRYIITLNAQVSVSGAGGEMENIANIQVAGTGVTSGSDQSYFPGVGSLGSNFSLSCIVDVTAGQHVTAVLQPVNGTSGSTTGGTLSVVRVA